MFAVDKIVNGLDCGSVVCTTFLDLRKAFDSLDNVTLLHRVQELGVHNVELQWFQNYFSNSVAICFLIEGLLKEVSLSGVHWDHYDL